MISKVATLLLDDVSMFEFGVVCEVFGIDRTVHGVPAFDFRICGVQPGEPVASITPGIRLAAGYGLDSVRGADLVVAPPPGAHSEFPNEVLAAVRDAADAGATVLSLCSGVFLLGEAGLLDGRRCTTHWEYVGELAARFPEATVDPDVLFVDEGPLVTSAGTAAGIDACLHVVRRELGSAVANTIARRMVVPPQRDGGQRQFIEQPVVACTSDNLSETMTWMSENLALPHTVDELAARSSMSTRTFARKFAAETGTTPVKWLTTQRVLYARQLLEGTNLGLEAISRRCGFGSGALLRHHFNRVVGVAPADYRRRFGNSAAERDAARRVVTR
ncbi:helix-turn-helix domain-containing protein [Rhodococcus tibetensis]|uniref:Helix-turn-helix domain-containing protein n=1 Tax=Rhodococcus tibetensis TaxID=2965064 RepID=A0ABT1QB68_9NOCA|nr:helix-turn-helix domain-containing protein [Rhodococcus sp. FXJ9.536]MCQ4119513.1 helix-turn-helix domain-containing protein [Rhodococcus sp. FXJ9.536]